jgi:hypothetical protein
MQADQDACQADDPTRSQRLHNRLHPIRRQKHNIVRLQDRVGRFAVADLLEVDLDHLATVALGADDAQVFKLTLKPGSAA